MSGTIGRHLADICDPLSIRLDQVIPPVLDLPHHSAVIHLAAVVGDQKVRADIENARTVNVDGAVGLARAVKQSRAARFIYVSTSHVYEVSSNATKLSENSPKLPRGQYALQKLIAEELIQDAFSNEPERLTIARVFSVIDRQQPEGSLGHSILKLPRDLSRKLEYSNDERDFLTPRIIAELLARLAGCKESLDVVNVCSGIGLSVREVAKLLLSKKEYELAEPRIVSGNSTAPRIVGNSDRLECALQLQVGALLEKLRKELLE